MERRIENIHANCCKCKVKSLPSDGYIIPKNALKTPLLVLIISLFLPLIAIAASNQSIELMQMSNAELLIELDKTLAQKDSFETEKQKKIEHLKSELKSSIDDEQRYWLTRNLYNEYKTYDSDSALVYVDLSLHYAKKAERQKWIDETNIYRSYIYAATGLFAEATKSIDEINPNTLDHNLYLQYNEQLLFLYTHRDQYIGLNSKDNPYTSQSLQLLESLAQDLPKTDPQYCWFNGWYSLSSEEKSKEAIPNVLSVVQDSEFSSVNDAKDAWILSRLYEKTGDDDNKLRFLILSAIADVRTRNKEIASLEEVALLMLFQNDLNRANEYINYCINCANEYKSRIRIGRLADLQHRITSAYQKEADVQKKSLHKYFIALITIVILLLCTLAFSFVQNKKLRFNKKALCYANAELAEQVKEQKRLQTQLREANEKLVKVNTELCQQVDVQNELQAQLKNVNDKLTASNNKLSQQVNELEKLQIQLKEANRKLQDMYSNAKQGTIELSETNYTKERYIADIFAICSNYINKLDDFRRNIYRMLIAHRYEDLKEMTKNPELSTPEIKELYRNFDKIFLGIYPNFVSDFNTLLKPEEQIVLKNGEQLNTELRIYALVRLGLTDSTKIAQFLHCSVRTVYNTRQRIRNKAIVPKDKFAEVVNSLGKTAY